MVSKLLRKINVDLAEWIENMKVKKVVIRLVLFVGMIMPISFLYASSNDAIHVLKISPQDHRAAIKDAKGKTRLIKPGDTVGKNGKVIAIEAERVVIEEKNGDEIEKVIIRLENGVQTIERVRKTMPQPPAIYAPGPEKVKSTATGSNSVAPAFYR